MAFTRGWDNATPPGTRDADEIDDIIRELKVDLYERFLAKLFVALPNTTVEADIVLRPEVSGKVTSKYLLIGPHGLQSQDDEDDTDYRDNHVEMEIGKDLRMDIHLPPGCTITDFDAVTDRMSSGTTTVTLHRQEYSTGVQTLIATTTRSANGIGFGSDVGVLAEVASNDRFYVVTFTSSNAILGSRFYGCRIQYDTPDCRNTY